MLKRRIFVSCGQETEPEKQLGRDVLAVIEQHGHHGFFAQEVHSPADLNSEVLRAIQSCDAFFAVMHQRGEVRYGEYPSTHRSSVWIQQEIAIVCYRMFVQARHVPIRVYMEKGILLEGVMKTAIVNPLPFERSEEVLNGLATWLTGRDFEEHPVLVRREELFRRRIQALQDTHWLVLELVAAHARAPGDFANYFEVRNDVYAILRAKGLADPEIETMYKNAFAELLAKGLLVQEAGGMGALHIGIPKQWWDLLLESLRESGRII